MNLNQLSYVHETVRKSLNITAAARSLNTSQSALSKQIRLLEDELGLEIFVRSKSRLVGVTLRGKEIAFLAERILEDVARIRRIGRDKSRDRAGQFTLAITHTQARYVLADAVKAFVTRYPGVQLFLHHGSPAQIEQLVQSGKADLGVTTTNAQKTTGLIAMPCRAYDRVAVMPKDHPLARAGRLSLAELAKHSLITYDRGFTGRSDVVEAFEQAGLTPHINLNASDADVIKKYVEQGLGIAILSEATFDRSRDKGLHMMPAKHLFRSSTTFVLMQRHRYLTQYEYAFIKLCGSQWTKARISELVARATKPTDMDFLSERPERSGRRKNG